MTNEQFDNPEIRIEGDTAIIMGVKYKRIKEPIEHRLTDDIIEEISVSYLKNCEGMKRNMRSAADWQRVKDEQSVEALLMIIFSSHPKWQHKVNHYLDLFKDAR